MKRSASLLSAAITVILATATVSYSQYDITQLTNNSNGDAHTLS